MSELSLNDQMLKAMSLINSKNSVSSKMKSDFNLQTMDWMKMLVAQLKNQDMNTSMDTNEMNKQMAQYAEVQAMQNMVRMQESMFAMSTTAYSAALIGKKVTVASMKVKVDSKGKKIKELVKVEGEVTGVTLFQGKPVIYVKGKPYNMNQIMVIGEAKQK